MKKECGRSMVEMLGTLAIIGVLSVTALVGYKIAMTKNRTNNILYDVNLAMNEIATRDYLNLPQITQHIRDLGVKTELDIVYARNGEEESNGFYIQVNGVSEDVCENLISNQTALMTKIQPYNDTEQAEDCAENIDVRAIFPYPPVEGGEVVEPLTCPEGYEEVVNGSCCLKSRVCGNNCCDTMATCDEDSGTCYAMINDEKVTCPEGKVLVPDINNYLCCDKDQYVAGLGFFLGCLDCPDNATCNGTMDVQCVPNTVWGMGASDTVACCRPDQWLDCMYYAECYDCPDNATCNGGCDVVCHEGQWDADMGCCADESRECIE